MANNQSNQPKKKHTLGDRMKVYKKRFLKLDKKTQIQIGAIAALIVLIVVAAVVALSGNGKNPASSEETGFSSVPFYGSYDPLADTTYQDEYTKLIAEYSDVVIPASTTEDRNYFRETIFVGDSNTEGLATYGHLSLQYVMGVTGMPINTVTTNKVMTSRLLFRLLLAWLNQEELLSILVQTMQAAQKQKISSTCIKMH